MKVELSRRKIFALVFILSLGLCMFYAGIQYGVTQKGATMVNGSTGPQGIQGVQGPQGVAGTNGTNGTNGISALLNQPYAYLIFNNATGTYAQNGTDGTISWSSNQPDNPVKWALGNLTEGRTNIQTVKLMGNYTFGNVQLNIYNYTRLDMTDASLWTNSETNTHTFINAQNVHDVIITGGTINGGKASGPWITRPTCINISLSGYNVILRDFEVEDWAGNGLEISANNYEGITMLSVNIYQNILGYALTMTSVTDSTDIFGCGFNGYGGDMILHNCVSISFGQCYFGGGLSNYNVILDACRSIYFNGCTLDSGYLGNVWIGTFGGGQNPPRDVMFGGCRITKGTRSGNNTNNAFTICNNTNNVRIVNCGIYHVTSENVYKHIVETQNTADYITFKDNYVDPACVGTSVFKLVGANNAISLLSTTPTIVFGTTSIGALQETTTTDSFANPIVVGSTVNITSISLYCRANTTANIQFALYSDNSGVPFTNLGNTTASAAPTDTSAWLTQSFTTPITLTPGTYWIVGTQSAKIHWQYSATGSCQFSSGTYPYLPISWVYGFSRAYTLSIYATGTTPNT